MGRKGRKGGRGGMIAVARKRLVLLVAALAWPAVAHAQTATLRITVVDPSSAVIVGARVEVKPAAAGVMAPPVTSSDGRGEAAFPLLEPGRYHIHVESTGFEAYDAR